MVPSRYEARASFSAAGLFPLTVNTHDTAHDCCNSQSLTIVHTDSCFPSVIYLLAGVDD